MMTSRTSSGTIRSFTTAVEAYKVGDLLAKGRH